MPCPSATDLSCPVVESRAEERWVSSTEVLDSKTKEHGKSLVGHRRSFGSRTGSRLGSHRIRLGEQASLDKTGIGSLTATAPTSTRDLAREWGKWARILHSIRVLLFLGRTRVSVESPSLFLVGDQERLQRETAHLPFRAEYRLSECTDLRHLGELLAANEPDLVVCDLSAALENDMRLVSVLNKACGESPILILAESVEMDRALSVVRRGAFDCVIRPLHWEAFQFVAKRALGHRRLRQQNRVLRVRRAGDSLIDHLVGVSAPLRELRGRLRCLADRDIDVLLQGEAGVGKGLAARALHYGSSRASSGSLVVMNCAAVPPEIQEYELFGVGDDTLRGMSCPHCGRVEAARGGTLYIEDVDQMPAHLLTRLLSIRNCPDLCSEDPSIERAPEARLVFATSLPSVERPGEKTILARLKCQTSMALVQLPPLRDRLEDLPLLVRQCLTRFGASELKLTPEAMNSLRSHTWPGNLLELENFMMRVCASHTRLRTLDETHLFSKSDAERVARDAVRDNDRLHLPGAGVSFAEVERILLEAAWEQSDRSQVRGARLLGIRRQAFGYRLQKYGFIPFYPKYRAARSPGGVRSQAGDSKVPRVAPAR